MMERARKGKERQRKRNWEAIVDFLRWVGLVRFVGQIQVWLTHSMDTRTHMGLVLILILVLIPFYFHFYFYFFFV